MRERPAGLVAVGLAEHLEPRPVGEGQHHEFAAVLLFDADDQRQIGSDPLEKLRRVLLLVTRQVDRNACEWGFAFEMLAQHQHRRWLVGIDAARPWP